MRTAKCDLTQSQVKTWFDYDPKTGIFIWKSKPSKMSRNLIGTIAGSDKGTQKYRLIGILGKYYLASRLAWLYMTGEWPKLEIDHINGIPNDDRWANLREVSHKNNCQNRKKFKRRVEDLPTGVYRNGKKFCATIMINGRSKHLGTFLTPKDASLAYEKQATIVFGQYKRLEQEIN